ncbi:MAG: hypothetical protein EBZ77_16525 [Chitinophagia bacterium]|nr:hypothetical protein [Chitinophagia bacterium]
MTSMTLGSKTGSIHFGVTVTAPSGLRNEIYSSALTHVVYAVPDTVRLEPISDGYALVAGRATSAQFVFSHTNATVNGMLAALAVPSVYAASPSTTVVELLGSFTSAKVLGATITAGAAQNTTITLMFESTRTVVVATVASGAIYTFPATAQCVATSNGPMKGTVLTLGRESKLEWSFGATTVPVGATHVCAASSGATVSPSSSTYVSVRGTGATYTIVPTAKQDIEVTLTLTFGSVTQTYTATPIVAANVYEMPTSLARAVSFTGPTAGALDASITKLAAGSTYGTTGGVS